MIPTKTIILLTLLAFSTVISQEKSIVFLGDSLTAGYGVEKEEAFPYLIQNQLLEKKFLVKVINAGESGNTSAGGLRRLGWYMKKQVDVLVIALGANDGLRGLPVKDTEENLQKMIDQAKAANPKIKIIIAGMKVPPNMGEEYATAFATLFPRIAEKNNCVLIPFLLENVAGHADYNLPDGIHPNAAGHKIIAKHVIDAVSTALKD